MSLRVIGAGVGRTGTHSLKLALEHLLEGPCYHMVEVFERPDDIPQWHGVAEGRNPDWHELLAGYVAAVDWPAAACWSELAAANPDALVLLSVRDPDDWWRSADRTIFVHCRQPPPPDPVIEAQLAMATDLIADRFFDDARAFDDRELAVAAFERWNDHVRATVPAERLVEWRPGDGWDPLCAALGVPVPAEPYPHTNTTEEFRARSGLDA